MSPRKRLVVFAGLVSCRVNTILMHSLINSVKALKAHKTTMVVINQINTYIFVDTILYDD